MTLKYVYGATMIVLAIGVTAGPAYAQRRDGSLLPQEESGQVTAVGCLVRGDAVRGGQKDKYVLARPKRGPVANVPEATCTADPGADALTLDNPEKGNMNDAMIGRWIEISGRLERETDNNPDNLRELDVLSAKIVPVVVPRPAAAVVAPRPSAAASPSAQPAPAAAMAPRPTPQAPAAAVAGTPQMLPDGELHSRDGIGRIILAGSGPHASVVPSPGTRAIAQQRPS